jgi:hypothetical protein
MRLRLNRTTQAEHIARQKAEILDLKKLVAEIQAGLGTCEPAMNSLHRNKSQASLQGLSLRGDSEARQLI